MTITMTESKINIKISDVSMTKLRRNSRNCKRDCNVARLVLNACGRGCVKGLA